MERRELLEALVELAREAGFTVRREAPGLELRSGVCRLRGELWLVLCEADTLEDRIATAAAALREHASVLLEARYLPPALRDCLESGSAPRR